MRTITADPLAAPPPLEPAPRPAVEPDERAASFDDHLDRARREPAGTPPRPSPQPAAAAADAAGAAHPAAPADKSGEPAQDQPALAAAPVAVAPAEAPPDRPQPELEAQPQPGGELVAAVLPQAAATPAAEEVAADPSPAASGDEPSQERPALNKTPVTDTAPTRKLPGRAYTDPPPVPASEPIEADAAPPDHAGEDTTPRAVAAEPRIRRLVDTKAVVAAHPQAAAPPPVTEETLSIPPGAELRPITPADTVERPAPAPFHADPQQPPGPAVVDAAAPSSPEAAVASPRVEPGLGPSPLAPPDTAPPASQPRSADRPATRDAVARRRSETAAANKPLRPAPSAAAPEVAGRAPAGIALGAAPAAAAIEPLLASEMTRWGERAEGPAGRPAGPAPTPPATAPDIAPRPPQAAVERSQPASGQGPPSGEMDRVRFVQRVARAVRSSADRGGPLRLRLSPPELGALRLEVQLRSGVLTARLEAETPAARALLLENLPQLRERLAEQNVQVGRFDVELLGSSPDGPGGRQAADARAQQPQWTQLGGRRKPLAAQMPLPDAPGGRPGAAAGQLNVII